MSPTTPTSRILRTAILTGASALALLTASAAIAADAEVATATAATLAASSAAGSGLGDIIVTGEKRETPIQSAPIAITAISGEALLQRNVNQLNDLNGYVPGLTIAKNEGAERVVAIRGIGYETAQNPNSQPGVAFHIDGVYIAHVMSLNQDLLDVDHIEVLRGPQGTVFGETSTGGAINVISKKPILGEASGTGQVSYGNYNYTKAYATVNLPLGDTVAMRTAVQYLYHGGYGHATAVPNDPDYPLDNASNIGARGSILWQPSDRFSALLSGQLFNADHNAALQKNIDDPDPRSRYVTQDYPGKFRIDTRMIYLTLTQQLGDIATLKSVSAYQYMNKVQSADNDRLASPYYFDHIVYWQDRSKAFTQELTLSSQNHDRLEWTVGGFYLRQHALQNILELTTAQAAAVVYNGVDLKYQTDSPYQHTSLAGYGQATFHATDALSLVAGARYSWDKITAQPVNYYTLFGVVAPRKATSSAVTGKLSAEYKLTPDNMIYVTGSRGYKPTGLNFNSGAILVPTSYRKETVTAAEIGTKNDFFNRMVRLNLSAYYYWYHNFQYMEEDPVPNAGGTANVPRADIYGLEAEGSVLPFDGLRLDGTVSLGRGRFKGDYYTMDAQTAAEIRASTYAALGYPAAYYYDPRIITAVASGLENTNGNRVPKLPGVQGQASATYSWAMAGGEVTLRGEIVYRGSYIYRIFNNSALDRVPAYTIFNAFIEYQPDAKPWSVSVSANNLTNKLGINSRFSDPYGSGTTSVEYIDPRQVFGTFAVKF